MATQLQIGESNLFGMKVLSNSGTQLEVGCGVCSETGFVTPAEFSATRCGSSKCGSTQGRTE